jgi:molybdopterin converting factor small subunit
MMVRIQLFARARDLAGAEWVTVELNEPSTVGELRSALFHGFPALKSLAARSAIALDDEFAIDSQSVDERSKLALLPPVSGGATSFQSWLA